MRMTASWSGRYGPTEYKVVARYFAPDGKLPSDRFVVPLKKITGARSKSALTENAPYKACSGFTHVTAHRIAQPPKATFVTRLQPCRLPSRAARQLPDQSTILRVESSSTDVSRLRGARPTGDIPGCLEHLALGHRPRCRSVLSFAIILCA